MEHDLADKVHDGKPDRSQDVDVDVDVDVSLKQNVDASPAPIPFVFIIGRSIQKDAHSKLTFRCYNSIRTYHPESKIIIVDDNSTLPDPYTAHYINTEIVQSLVPGMAELGLYYYFWTAHPAERCLILHDSMFLRSPINPRQEPMVYLWNFDAGCIYSEEPHTIEILLRIDPSLFGVYHGRKWDGCFGLSVLMDWAFVNRLQERYNLFQLRDIQWTRPKRCAMERVIGVLCYDILQSNPPPYCGNIWEHPSPFSEQELGPIDSKLPIMKTWYSR